MNMNSRAKTGFVLAALVGLFLYAAPAPAADMPSAGETQISGSQVGPKRTGDGVKSFTLSAVEIDGTKFWLPSTIIVRRGAQVELTLVNKLDAPHGFEIDGLDVKVEVPAKGTMKVRFIAKDAGTYAYDCQLHAAHIGGQILVEK